jgi:CheY-like chemotaxis protein
MAGVVGDLEDYLVTVDPQAALDRTHARKYGPQQHDTEEEDVFLPAEESLPTAEDPSETVEPARTEAKAPAAKTILCVESQAEIQDALRKNLSRMGYRVFLVGDAERAAERYREAPTDAVIFDVDGLGPEALEAIADMYDKAQEEGSHPLVALVLLGPRQRALKDKLPPDDRRIVLSKPIKLKEVQDAITELLPV